MHALLALALSAACATAQAPTHAVLLRPLPTLRWYLGANCVGTPGGTVTLAPGCGNYLIFGTLLTMMVTTSNVTSKWNIVTYVNEGCSGAIGVLFVDVPYAAIGSAPVCIASTTADRCGDSERAAARERALAPAPPTPHTLHTHALNLFLHPSPPLS